MYTKMKTKFNFVNIDGGVYTDVTEAFVHLSYTVVTYYALTLGATYY
jgi:hypothetical protein